MIILSSCIRWNSRLLSHTPLRKFHLLRYVEDMKHRGLLRNSHPSNLLAEFPTQLKATPAVFYAGFDPTADSLHIGNLLILVNLLRGVQFGIKPIAIVGGATAAVGDPSGRDTERVEAHIEEVSTNCHAIIQQLEQISENVFSGTHRLQVVNNNDWFGSMSMVEYLRSCKQLRVGEMLRMGAIKNRMSDNSGISFTEFSYQTMQAYDWLKLAKEEKCYFQIGGSDQLGHLDLGAHLIKRNIDQFAAGICLPLITDAAGNKLGKSVGGGIWLSHLRTSPFQFYQFFRQLHDTEAEDMLPKFSLRPMNEVESILEEHRKNLGKCIAQQALAEEMTQVVHGQPGLESALRCSRVLFYGSFDDLVALKSDELGELFGKSTLVNSSEVSTMGQLANCTRSDQYKGDKLMTQGAFKVNGVKMTDPSMKIDKTTVILPKTTDLTLIRWGKRKFQLVKWI